MSFFVDAGAALVAFVNRVFWHEVLDPFGVLDATGLQIVIICHSIFNVNGKRIDWLLGLNRAVLLYCLLFLGDKRERIGLQAIVVRDCEWALLTPGNYRPVFGQRWISEIPLGIDLNDLAS